MPNNKEVSRQTYQILVLFKLELRLQNKNNPNHFYQISI